MTGGTQSFKAVVGKAPGGALLIPVPFDPDTVWGKKPRHHVRGQCRPLRLAAARSSRRTTGLR